MRLDGSDWARVLIGPRLWMVNRLEGRSEMSLTSRHPHVCSDHPQPHADIRVVNPILAYRLQCNYRADRSYRRRRVSARPLSRHGLNVCRMSSPRPSPPCLLVDPTGPPCATSSSTSSTKTSQPSSLVHLHLLCPRSQHPRRPKHRPACSPRCSRTRPSPRTPATSLPQTDSWPCPQLLPSSRRVLRRRRSDWWTRSWRIRAQRGSSRRRSRTPCRP